MLVVEVAAARIRGLAEALGHPVETVQIMLLQ
jgi:hypothetical protein